MNQLKLLAKNIIKSPVLLVFVIICALLLPTSINTMSVAFRSAIALAVGIDINEQDEVELLVAINVSSTTESLVENSKVLSATGKTIGDAFTNLNTMFGRSVKLQHTRFVMIGKRVSEQNLSHVLDRLVRTSKMRNTVQLVFCPDSIVDMFSIGTQLKKTTGIKLNEIVCYLQNDSTTSVNSNIDAFYKGYYNPSKISKINLISLSDDYTKGVSATTDVGASSSSEAGGESGGNPSSQNGSSSSGGGASSSSSSSNGADNSGLSNSGNSSGGGDVVKKFVSNRGEMAIFKEGKLVKTLDKELSNGINWLSTDYNPKDLFVRVPKANILKNATINFDILSKKVAIETFFYKNIPFLSAQVVISLDIDEIISDDRIVELKYDVMDDSVRTAIGGTIREQIAKASKLAKDENLDLFELNNIFYQKNYKDYINYLKNGHNEQDILQNTQISVDVSIKIV